MEENPILFLQSYGLDQLLTDQDDPYLWSAAVDKHWPKLDDPIDRCPDYFLKSTSCNGVLNGLVWAA